MARIAVAIGAFLILLGLVLYGFSAEVHHRIWRDIAARPGGMRSMRWPVGQSRFCGHVVWMGRRRR